MRLILSATVPTKPPERMVVIPVNRYHKLQLQLYQLQIMGVNTGNDVQMPTEM